MFISVGFMLFSFPHNGRLDKVPIKPFVSLYKLLKAIHIIDARQNFLNSSLNCVYILSLLKSHIKMDGARYGMRLMLFVFICRKVRMSGLSVT